MRCRVRQLKTPGFSAPFCTRLRAGSHQKPSMPWPKTISLPEEKCINLLGLSLADRLLGGGCGGVETAACAVAASGSMPCSLPAPKQKKFPPSAGPASMSGFTVKQAQPLGDYLTDRFATPLLVPSSGAPVGFDAMAQFITEVCDAARTDPQPALEGPEWGPGPGLSGGFPGFTPSPGCLGGLRFAVKAPVSVTLPLTRWLYDYLGMIPAAVYPEPGHGPYHESPGSFFRADSM